MVTSVTFRGGGETTGSVADRRIETAKQETTGGVGARNNQDSIFTVDNELKQDTVCFRASAQEPKKETSTLGVIFGTAAVAALIVGGLGLAHKYDIVGKIKNEKAKEFFRHTDAVTKPCREACAWVKNNCYEKVISFFRSKKP